MEVAAEGGMEVDTPRTPDYHCQNSRLDVCPPRNNQHKGPLRSSHTPPAQPAGKEN